MLKRVLGDRGRLLLFACLSYMVPFTLLRLGFYWFFKSGTVATPDLLHAFYLGFKFDLRIALIFTLVPALGMLGKPANPFVRARAGRIWLTWWGLCFVVSLFFYILDFAYYSYLGLRVNATVLHFLENPLISLEMVWESYPVLQLMVALTATTTLFVWWLRHGMQLLTSPTPPPSAPSPGPPVLKRLPGWARGLVVGTLIVGGLYGKLSAYPLRWSEAYFSTNTFISSLGMNPIHYFFDTLKNRQLPFDEKLVRKYYPHVAAYLGVDQPDAKKLNFDRWLTPRGPLPPTTNVVLIVMESFAAHKTGVGGHPLDPTPRFDALAKQSKYFKRFFVPSEGTARSIFGLITGIPDVNPKQTSSRNPLIVDQHTLINAFTKHKKFYFIGGSANWGNIRGVIANNIPDMKIVEEGMFESSRTDVWGISDLDLFTE
ncbi:MAG: sulfatase-like hydrolase/transferase, partial [Bdellovibrionales bacterium]|nr:sulfatase-like hydrolase/transferase [Bdellovibrionales bacterium]